MSGAVSRGVMLQFSQTIPFTAVGSKEFSFARMSRFRNVKSEIDTVSVPVYVKYSRHSQRQSSTVM